VLKPVYIYILLRSSFIYDSVFIVQRATENALSNSSIITIFSTSLIGLKTLQNDEGRQHTV